MIINTGWAGCLTGSAAKAAIKMLLGIATDGLTLKQLLEQIYSPAWAIQLIPGNLIGGTSGQTETTVNTFTQDRFSF